MAAGLLARSLVALTLLGATLVAQDAPRLLTQAAQLRALSPEEARLPYPVRLKATVTLVEPGRTIFLRDETGAAFIRGGKEPLEPGQVVEVEGTTYPGLYVTGISATRATVLAEGPLPKALELTYEQLASGQYHYEWVQVRGIVRAVTPSPDSASVKLALGDGALDLFLVDSVTDGAENLIDAAVTVTGLAAGFINDRRQLVAPHLRLQSLDAIHVVEPAPANPFDAAITPGADLLHFAPGGRAGHRVKVRGVVTHHDPGTAVYLRDGDIGVRIRTNAPEAYAPGQVVEALGFPAMGRLSAELEDAVLRATGESESVPPVQATVKDILSGRLDADLVEVIATVRDVVREADRLTLTMQSGDAVFSAIVHQHAADFAAPEPGSTVRMAGVCRIVETTQPARSYSAKPRSFELVLRNQPGDLTILQRPSWWTTERLAVAASSLLGVAVLALAWVILLGRQVRRQTDVIRTQVEVAAIADERQRIAREFHDTLEQELVGVSLRLDAAATRAEDSRLKDLLAATQRLVQQLQTGARSFVWNLRDSTLAGQPLATAIGTAISTITAGRQVEIRTTGESRRIPETIGHELLRVAQEAATNAVKHGGARRLAITLDFTADRVQLTAHDDGAGFDSSAPVPAGHFGLIGMRERVQKLGGEFTLRSAPGTGTTVEVTVPLPHS